MLTTVVTTTARTHTTHEDDGDHDGHEHDADGDDSPFVVFLQFGAVAVGVVGSVAVVLEALRVRTRD